MAKSARTDDSPIRAKTARHAAYALDKNYQTLSVRGAIADSPGGGSVTPLTFRIVGDGKELWRATMQKAGSPQG